MPYDETLAERLRRALASQDEVVERKMFGGLAFMVHGHMTCGVAKDTLMLRVGPEAYEEVLALDHARPMDFTGRPLKGMVYVDPEGYSNDEALTAWIGRALDFVLSMPPK